MTADQIVAIYDEWCAADNGPGSLTWAEWEAQGLASETLRRACRVSEADAARLAADLADDENAADALWERLGAEWQRQIEADLASGELVATR